MRRVLIALVAVGIVVGGGVAYAVINSSDADAQEDTVVDDAATDETVAVQAQDDGTTGDDADDGDAAGDRPARGGRDAIAPDVLADLVDDGVITQEQADAILDALATRIEELRAERGERGDGRGGFGPGRFGDLRELLDDDVIDADELAELGEDHVLNDPDGPFAEYLDDGELTSEELETVIGELRGAGRLGDQAPEGGTDETGEGADSDDTDGN
jgi:polyhydroxyalkanoate synthesis regulator phasin